MAQKALFNKGPSFTNRTTKSVTFQGKLGLPIHRWYRLTPSFSPELANDIANHFNLSADDMVLDPFSGVGTVPLCMKYRGIPACSVEINPYLHFVGTVKTRTYKEVSQARPSFVAFVKRFRELLRSIPFETSPQSYLEENADFIPKINFPERWWSPGNLAQLVCLRKALKEDTSTGRLHDLLRMGALGILIPTSNAKHNHVSLTFAEKPLPTADVASILEIQLDKMAQDLENVQSLPCSEVTIIRGNSKELRKVLPAGRKISAVITSPPYPNRFSYARETRPHLFYFDFIESAQAVGQLEIDAIGGTWGKATSILAEGVEPKNAVVAELLNPYTPQIADGGKLMANYVTKYFNDIYDHAGQVAEVCDSRARLAYVIGNSKFYESPLPSDEILAGIFEHFGFRLTRIDRMRRRQSKTGLYEAVVFMERG